MPHTDLAHVAAVLGAVATVPLLLGRSRPVVLLGLAVLILQGLGDGTLVASRDTLAWLIPAGLAVGGLTVAEPRAVETDAGISLVGIRE